jgi:phosphatidylinositol alpha 1,6-mannosyltransferase
VHNRADRTLAPTQTVAADLIDRGFRDVVVWGRGVDHDQFDPRRRSATFRQAVGVRDGEVLIGYIGRLAVEKHVELLAPLQHIRGARLVVVGDGPERAALQRKLPGATFSGFLTGDRLGEAMASLDLFVHTGPHETYCQAIQEAMAAGIPVVAPAAGGPLDLVAHGRTGLLCPAAEPGQIARAAAALVELPELRAQMSQCARESVAGRTWSAIGDELVGVYRGLLAAGPSDTATAA